MAESLTSILNPSRAFSHAGIYVMRSERIYLFVACEPIGVRGHGPHKHNDWLSFELCIDDQPLVVDPGTFCYTGNMELRRMFRSTSYHNTVVVDGGEQVAIQNSEFGLVNPHGEVRVLRWESDAKRDLLEAEHTGYGRSSGSLVHRRCFSVDKLLNVVEITDTFSGKGNHLFEWYYHLEIGLECRIEGNKASIYKDRMPIGMIELQGKVETCEVRNGWISKAYNHREQSEILYLNRQDSLPKSKPFSIRLLPIDALVQNQG